MEYRIGMLARSKAGRDHHKMYVVWDADEKYVYLINGRNHTPEHAKRKKRIHLQPVREIPEELKKIYADGKTIYNEEIRAAVQKILNSYNKKEAIGGDIDV